MQIWGTEEMSCGSVTVLGMQKVPNSTPAALIKRKQCGRPLLWTLKELLSVK